LEAAKWLSHFIPYDPRKLTMAAMRLTRAFMVFTLNLSVRV
jgi:hypothetical protein